MDYRIEVSDRSGRRIAATNDVPLLEAQRTAPDEPDRIRGLLPEGIAELGHGYGVRVFIDGALFCEAPVTRVAPRWSDTRKLILDRYVAFHELLEFEAELPAAAFDGYVARAFRDRDVADIARALINRTTGRLHYRVAHGAYPDGAQREYAKFLARMAESSALPYRSIASGQWVGADRIDLSAAYAKDGDTIAGLVVDGAPWPHLRMMLVDCEEMSLNSHAIARHPEVATWSAARYAASGYALSAESAKNALQHLLDEKGIAYIELNPHRGDDGAYDDRVDAYGRYVGVVYGGGECFNTALIELGHSEVYLYANGRYHAPEMALKEHFSYVAPSDDTIPDAGVSLAAIDVQGNVYEALTALAYAAGAVWSVDVDGCVRFAAAGEPRRVVVHDALRMGITLASSSEDLANVLLLQGNPTGAAPAKTYVRGASADAYGARTAWFPFFATLLEADADRIVDGVLADVAYPEIDACVELFDGADGFAVGDLIELRGDTLRRFAPAVADEWDGRYAGRIVGRIRAITHRFSGRQVHTVVDLTSPLRSVSDPLAYIVRSQHSPETFYRFRLDADEIGLDDGDYHLD